MFNLVKKFWLVIFMICSFIFILNYLLEQAVHISKPLYFSWIFFFSMILFTILFWITASFTWKYLLSITCNVYITLFQSFSQLVLVSIGKYIPGKIWGIIARGTQLKKLGIDVKKIFVTSIQEQILLIHASVIISSISIIFLIETNWAYLLMIIILLSGFIGKYIQRFLIATYNLLMNYLKKNIIEVKEIITQQNYLSLLVFYMMIWILSGLIFSGIYFVFITQNELNLTIIVWMILANTISITLGFFALFAPAGIGVRESVSSIILSQIMPLEQAIFLSLLFRFWIVLTELSLGMIIGYLLGKNIFKKHSVE
ncbi:MAG TPA: hypothetical protein ENK59_09080 [Thioploca sp.]|nr:hypothetical protein [Thioploca sp.]